MPSSTIPPGNVCVTVTILRGSIGAPVPASGLVPGALSPHPATSAETISRSASARRITCLRDVDVERRVAVRRVVGVVEAVLEQVEAHRPHALLVELDRPDLVCAGRALDGLRVGRW